MARTALPVSKLKSRRRRRRLRIALLVTFFAILLVLGAILSLRAPFWKIATVEVSGTESVSEANVRQFVEQALAGMYLYVFPKNNVLMYRKEALERALREEFPSLSEVTLKAQNLTMLTVTVTEYAPDALWCGETPGSSSCLLIDRGGVAYAPAVGFAGNAYVRYYGVLQGQSLPRQYLTKTDFRTLRAFLDSAVMELSGEVLTDVAVDEHRDARAHFASNFTLIIPLAGDEAAVYQRFLLALSSEPFAEHEVSDFEYLDLRFGDKLYYKLKE
jgi:hypothetical protein